MREENEVRLTGVAETLLIPVYIRAQESEREDALLRDPAALAFYRRHEGEFDHIRSMRLDDGDRTALVLRNREFDRLVLSFLQRHPGGMVIHVGCGFDARFERVDDGCVEWFDIDLPEVCARRSLYLPTSNPRYHLVSGSIFDGAAWPPPQPGRRVMVMAEGVFMYFSEPQVRALVGRILERYPGSELAFDGFSRLLVWANNRRIKKSGIGARYAWALNDGRTLEAWYPQIRLATEWFPLESDEPRMKSYRWMRRIHFLSRVMGVYHFQMGRIELGTV